MRKVKRSKINAWGLLSVTGSGLKAAVWRIDKIRTLAKCLCGLLGFALLGCTSDDNRMVAGDLAAINHVEGTAINWFSVNGYRAHGGGGSSCCIIMPVKWRPGLKAEIEWEVDPDRFAKIKRKKAGFGFDEEAWAKHTANFRTHSAVVDIPEWPEKRSCSLNVHFLTCNRVKVTTSCSIYGQPDYPIKESRHAKEPVVCMK